MAEAYGLRLLKGVERTTLSELLSTVSTKLPADLNTSVPPISFLQALLHPPSRPLDPTTTTGIDLNAGIPIPLSQTPPSSSPIQPANQRGSLESSITYTHPPIVEILSSTTNGGSTTVLIDLVYSLLLPRVCAPKQLVIFFDCAYKLSVPQLLQTFLDRGTSSEIAHQDAFSRLHIIRPGSSRQLLTHLRKLEDYVFSLPDEDCSIGGLIIADLSVFYWSERYDDEEARFQASENVNAERVYSRESLHTMIVAAVERFRRAFHCPIIVSGLGIPDNNSTTEGERSIRSGLATPWTKAIDIKVILGAQVEDRVEVCVDGRKWLKSCGAMDGVGRGSYEMKITRDGVRLGEFTHES